MADVFFWKAPEDQPEATATIQTSTFRSGDPWTDAKGELRAVFAPEPGRRYRFRFAGIHEPNMPPGINPATANKHGYAGIPHPERAGRADRRQDDPVAVHPSQDGIAR